jgi:hypothetical protein
VVLLFLPAVAHVAVETDLASAAVVRYGNVIFGLPVDAGLDRWMGTMDS